MATEHPQRSCVGCRKRRGIIALARITDGDVPIIDGPSSGRGAWLCRSESGIDHECLVQALRSRGFSRAWRRSLGDDESGALRELLEAWRPDV